MKTPFEKLKSPYLDGEPELAVPTNEWNGPLEHVIDESPFSNIVDEAQAHVDEAEGRIPGDDLIETDEAFSLDREDERDSIDDETVSGVEDERPKAGAVRRDTQSNKARLSVTVILDQPAEPDDRFQLAGSSGSYTKTLAASDAKALVAGQKILRFEVEPDKKGYNLTHHRSREAKRTIFLEKRIQDMTAAGHGPQTAEYSYLRLDSQVPRNLPDRYGITRDVKMDLVQRSPLLVDLQVKDPEL
jgi:hypothetical protein